MQNWNNLPTAQKISSVLSIPICVAIVALAILQIVGVWENAGNVYVPLLGALQLCQAASFWKESRRLAYFSLVTGILILIASTIVLLLK